MKVSVFIDETKQLLKSKSPLLWVTIGLWLTSSIRTQYGNFHNNDGALDVFISLSLEIVGLVALLSFLRWRGKTSYIFIAGYALVAFVGTMLLLHLYLTNLGFELLKTDTYLLTTFLLEIIIVALSIPMFVLALRYLLFTVKMERKLKAMNVDNLLRHYFESTRVYWECVKAKNPSWTKIEKEAQLEASWAIYELKKRDPQLEDLIKGMSNPENGVKDKTADKIIEKYGRHTLQPFEKDWSFKDSPYFSKLDA